MDVTVWVDVPEGARGMVARRSLRELAELLSDLGGRGSSLSPRTALSSVAEAGPAEPASSSSSLQRLAASERLRIGPKESFRDRDSLRPDELLEELDRLAEPLGVPDLLESTIERILARAPLHDDDDPHLVEHLRPDWTVLRDAVLFARRTGHSAWVEGPLTEGGDLGGVWGPPRHPWVPDDLSGLRLPWDGLVAGIRALDLQGSEVPIEEAVLWGRWCQQRFAQWRREGSRNDLRRLAADRDLRVVLLGTWHAYASAFTWEVRPGGTHWASTLPNGRLDKADLDRLLRAVLATLEDAFGLVEEEGAVHLVSWPGYRHPPPDHEGIRQVLTGAKADGMRLRADTLRAFVEQSGGRIEALPGTSPTAEFAISHRTGNLEVGLLDDGRIATILVR